MEPSPGVEPGPPEYKTGALPQSYDGAGPEGIEPTQSVLETNSPTLVHATLWQVRQVPPLLEADLESARLTSART